MSLVIAGLRARLRDAKLRARGIAHAISRTEDDAAFWSLVMSFSEATQAVGEASRALAVEESRVAKEELEERPSGEKETQS